MKYAEYIKQLEALKAAAEADMKRVIFDVEGFAYEALSDWIDGHLSTMRGAFVANAETVQILNDFDAAYIRVLTQMDLYDGAVSNLVKSLPAMRNTIKAFQISEGVEWAKANTEPSEKLVINEIIRAYKNNGLNAKFVQPLRDQLYQNVAAGTNVKEAKEGLKQYIKGGKDKSGKLGRYLTQTSQQATDSYTGAINKKLMNTFDYNFLIMSGSLIETSSPQCVRAIHDHGGILTDKIFREDMQRLAENNGLIDGTDFKNLPFNKLHWGCKHEFTPAMTKPNRN